MIFCELELVDCKVDFKFCLIISNKIYIVIRLSEFVLFLSLIMGNCLRHQTANATTASSTQKESYLCFSTKQINIITNILTIRIDKHSRNSKMNKFDELEKISLIERDCDSPPPVVLTDDEIKRMLMGSSGKHNMGIMNALIPSPDKERVKEIELN